MPDSHVVKKLSWQRCKMPLHGTAQPLTPRDVHSPAVTDAAAPRTLRLLLVEDTDDDAVLIARSLRQAGFAPEIHRVETAAAFRAALREADWDLVISDHSLPQFSSTAALACLQESELDLPFIVVSGSIDEES